MKTTGLRVAARIARRTARRNLRRSVLIVAMIALPVALTTATATVARTIIGSPEADAAAVMGAADVAISPPDTFREDRLRRRLPRGAQTATLRFEYHELVRQGELLYATTVEVDRGLTDPLLEGLYGLAAGRPPAASGEAAVNRRLLEAFGADVGEVIELGGYDLKVTGLATARDLDHPLAIVAPGTLAGRANYTQVLVDLPPGASVEEAVGRIKHHGYNTRREVTEFAANDATTWDAVSLIGGILALFATGLIAAAAFVVGARRQLRQLGLIGAAGGEPHHVRAVVWLGGTTLGLVGGVVGSTAGIVLALGVQPFLSDLAGREVGSLAINPLVMLAAALVGTCAATAAALAPARTAGKISVTAALSGLTPPPRRPGRVAAFGLGVMALGAAVTAWATIRMENDILAFGLVGMITGVLLGIPLLVTGIGKLAGALPATARLAARDSARHGRKTGAAVAAGVIALAVPVAVSAYSLSEEAYERRQPRLLENQVLIGALGDAAKEGMPDEVTDAFQDAFPGSFTVPLSLAVQQVPRLGREPVYAPVIARGELSGDVPGQAHTTVAWPVFVGDGAMLRALGAGEGAHALEQGRAVVLGGYEPRNRLVRLRVGAQWVGRIPAVAIDSPGYLNESIPKIVVPTEVGERLGLGTRTDHHLLTNPTALTDTEIARAREIAANHTGVFVNTNDDYLPPYATARALVTAATIPLALAILAVAVALVVSESRRSRQILVAVGAGPLEHRKIVASTAALLAVVTGVLAVPAGFLPAAVVQASAQSGRIVVVPWVTIVIVVTTVPLLAALLGALVTRTPRLGSLLTPTM